MAILASDTFAGRTNTGTWNTASDGHIWTMQHAPGPATTINVSGGEGRAHGSNTDTQMLLGSGTATDQEGLVRLSLGQTGDSIGLLLRCDGTNANYYYAEIGDFTNDLAVYKVVNSSKSFLDIQPAGFTISNASFYWMRFQVIGTTLKCRLWPDGQAEPGTWQSTVTDSALSSGQYGIFLNCADVTDALFDSYQASDTQAGIALTGTLAGVGTLAGTFSLATALAVTFAGQGQFVGAFAGQAGAQAALVQATFRDGRTQATYRDGLVQIGGR